MKQSDKILASYATFKQLYSNGDYKSPYQLLNAFIQHSILLHQNQKKFLNVILIYSLYVLAVNV